MVSSQVLLFVDGELDGEGGSPPDMRNMVAPFFVGCNWKKIYSGFRGEIYDLVINDGDNGMPMSLLLPASRAVHFLQRHGNSIFCTLMTFSPVQVLDIHFIFSLVTLLCLFS